MSDIWFQSAGTRLFAAVHGQGMPIVVCHGGLANHLVALRFGMPLVERGFQLVAPDLRGSGRSHFAGPLSWDQLADDIVALLDHLDLARAVVAGTSFGAGVTIATALRHPERVSGLVLLAPAYAGADVGLSPPQQAAMNAMDAAGSRAPAEGMRVMDPLVDTLPLEIRERARALFHSYDPASVAASTAFMASGAQPFAAAADLARVTAPALVVPGTDPQHPAEYAEHFRRHLPRCTVVAGAEADYARLIADWVTGPGSSP